MFASKLLKNPILIIGILFFVIFIYDLRSRKGYFFDREELKANSCRSSLVKLNKRIPKTWEASCEKDNIFIEIKSEANNKKIEEKNLKSFLYRELANSLIFIAENAFLDSLEKVMIVRIKLISNDLVLNAITEGKYLVKFKTIKEKKFILVQKYELRKMRSKADKEKVSSNSFRGILNEQTFKRERPLVLHEFVREILHTREGVL